MKKTLSIILATTMLILTLVSCKKPQEPTGEIIRVAGMKGPTGIGLVSLADKSENSENDQEYSVAFYKSAEEIVPLLVKGELDIAAVPANLAAIQFNKNNEYIQVIAINNLGVLSILEKGSSINSVADLKGKTIYAPVSGKGAVPEYALNYILKENGIDPLNDVTVEWKTEVTEIIGALKNADGGIAMLPQPAATNALTKVEGLREAINVNEAWNSLETDSKLVTGVIVVRKDFAEKNSDAVAKFLKEYETSAKFASENVEETAKLAAKFGIAEEAVALGAIPKCNITFIKGEEMKKVLSAYLKTLYDANASAVGGAIPKDNFYYVEK